jgi:site-specific DNA recombinase
MVRVVGYARVSNREQAINSHALEQQIERLKAAGASNIYVDVESGYKSRRRPELEKLLEHVRDRIIDEVIVTRLDRLSRKGVQSFAIFEDFLQAGVSLRALDEPFDLTTAAGRMTAGVLVVVAQHHSDQKTEAVRHGWQHLRDRKVAMNPPFGYIKVNDKHQLDHREFLCLLDTRQVLTKAEIARDIIDTFFQQKTVSLTMRAINLKYGILTICHGRGRFARDMFRFSPAGLSTWLKSPVLQGHLVYLKKRGGKQRNREDWVIHYNTHPDQRLLSDEEAEEIKAILEHNRQVRGYGTTAQKYPLSGLIFCAECRGACYSLKGNRGHQPGYNHYFQCKNWRARGCSQKAVVRMDAATEAVIEAISQRAQAISSLADTAQPTPEPNELKQLRTQLSQLETIPGNNPVIEQAKRDLRGQIVQWEHSLTQSTQIDDNQRTLLLTFQDKSYWHTLLPEEQQQMFRRLVERVIVRDGRVEQVILKV